LLILHLAFFAASVGNNFRRSKKFGTMSRTARALQRLFTYIDICFGYV
jgi:hypothetical protein